ncbi:MAG: hypothetical protein ACI4GY_07625 [Acutalibacteraceae bacterium]
MDETTTAVVEEEPGFSTGNEILDSIINRLLQVLAKLLLKLGIKLAF